MNNAHISINFPADILEELNLTEEEIQEKLRLFIGIQFYKEEKLTLAKAARLSGLTRFQFEKILLENDISITENDFDTIINDANKLLKKNN